MEVVRRAQSELLTTVALIGLALVIGIAMISLVGSTVSSYREQALLINTLNSEISNTFVNLITYDDAGGRLWLLLKRLDSSRTDFFIAIAADTQYLQCSSVQYFNPAADTNGIMCDEGGDCPSAQQFRLGDPKGIYVPYGGGITTLVDFIRARDYGIPTASYVPICTVRNVCNLAPTPGLCTNNTIFRVSLPIGVKTVRVFIFTLFSNNLYLVNVYEVRTS